MVLRYADEVAQETTAAKLVVYAANLARRFRCSLKSDASVPENPVVQKIHDGSRLKQRNMVEVRPSKVVEEQRNNLPL